MAAGAVWATSLPLDKSDKSEKQRPDEEILAKKVINRAHYAKMKTDGNDNGAPYGLTLRSVDNKQVSLSWISPEPTDDILMISKIIPTSKLIHLALSDGRISMQTMQTLIPGKPANS